MKSRLLLTAASLVFAGVVFMSCNKERIPPPSTARQAVSGESKSSGSTSSSTTSDASNHPSGCSGGNGG